MAVPLLAKEEDVARVLQVDKATLPEGTKWSLEVASSWARRYTRSPGLGIKGSSAVSFYDRRDDSYLRVLGTVTKVEVRRSPGAALEELSEGTQWTAQEGGVRLRAYDYPATEVDPRFGDTRLGRTYAEVQVSVTTTEEVDVLVTEAVAHAAAAMITQGPRQAKGLVSEVIGDYAYNRNLTRAAEGSPFFNTAKGFLAAIPGAGGVPFVP